MLGKIVLIFTMIVIFILSYMLFILIESENITITPFLIILFIGVTFIEIILTILLIIDFKISKEKDKEFFIEKLKKNEVIQAYVYISYMDLEDEDFFKILIKFIDKDFINDFEKNKGYPLMYNGYILQPLKKIAKHIDVKNFHSTLIDILEKRWVLNSSLFSILSILFSSFPSKLHHYIFHKYIFLLFVYQFL